MSEIKDFKIMQWNAYCLSSHLNELKHFLSKQKQLPDVICIQETFLKKHRNLNIDYYTIVRRDRDEQHGGGLATCIRTDLNFKELKAPDDIECLLTEITVNKKTYTIVNIYQSPAVIYSYDSLSKLFKYKNVIVTGDMNAHNPLWKSVALNSQGKILEKILDDTDCCILNTGIPTYQKAKGGTSILDLTIVSNNIALNCNWFAINDTLGSDHCPTFTTFEFEAKIEENEIGYKWFCHKAEWDYYKTLCKRLLNEAISSEDINSFSDNVINAIQQAALKSIPKSSGKTHKKKLKPLPYWNDKCTIATKNRNKARNKFNRSKLPPDGIEYRKTKALAQKTIRETSRNYWHKFCTSIDKNSTLGAVWNMSKKMQGGTNQFVVPTLKDGDTYLETNKDKANKIAEVFASNSDNKNFTAKFLENKQNFEQKHVRHYTDKPSAENNNLAFNKPFSLDELKQAIKNCKNKTSPGSDTIHYEMIKKLPSECLDVILKLYNQIYAGGVIPKSWKHAIIVPIRKADKNPENPDSYRPISLTSCLCKVMEKLVNNRLVWYLESKNLLNNAQTGFRQSRSTIDQITKLQDRIYKYNKNKGVTVGVFLDFEKAYDMIWRPGLMYKIKKMGITGNMFQFINSFVDGRTFQVKVGTSLSNTFELKNGTPQGSIISPTLFLIMINDLDVDNELVELSLFADDSAVYKSGKSLNRVIEDIQNSLDKISKWCDLWGMKISATKSCGVIFTQKTKTDINKPLTINGVTLKMADKVKFLGMIFDSKLTWTAHFDYTVTKCKRRINLMRSITGTDWGACKKSLLTVYRALIRSLLDYGSIALDNASETNKQKFDVVQCTALRICCGAMTGTSLAAMQVECGEMPLEIRRKQQMLRYATKIKATQNHPAKSILDDNWRNYYGNFGENREPFAIKIQEFFTENKIDIQPNVLPPDPPWEICLFEIDKSISESCTKNDQPEIIKTLAFEALHKYQSSIFIYTDGSKDTRGRVGSAVVIPEFSFELAVRITDNLSVFSAELYAILCAIHWIIENDCNRVVCICSDSLSSIQALENADSRSRPNLVKEIFRTKNKIKSCKIVLLWVPSHIGINGNERADKLAKQALSLTNTKTLPFEISDARERIDDYVLKLWQDNWTNSEGNIMTKKLNPQVKLGIKYSNNNRSQEVKISRLRLGRCRLNRYLRDIGKHTSGECEVCGTPETIEHFVMYCRGSKLYPAIKQACQKYFVPYAIEHILSNSKVIEAFLPLIQRAL